MAIIILKPARICWRWDARKATDETAESCKRYREGQSLKAHGARLPRAQLAVVDPRKVTSYLLSSNHPAGRVKAAFFHRFGFRAQSWQRLRDALVEHAHIADIISVVETEFGKKYILEGPIAAPDGRTPRIWTVWFVAIGEAVPRLVTAYPAAGDDR
jgi:hypothetical protein